MFNLITSHFDPHTIKGIALGFGSFILLLVIVGSVLKPFSRRRREQFYYRRRPQNGLLLSLVVIVFFFGWAKLNSASSGEENESTSNKEKSEQKNDRDYSYRTGSDIFFEGEQQFEEQQQSTKEEATPLSKEESKEKTMRVNQRPSHSKMNTSPETKRVESSTSNVERSFTSESRIYYIQISKASTLDEGQERVTRLEQFYQGEIFLAKGIDNDINEQFEILRGPFATKSNARSASRGQHVVIRSELDEDLFFIDY